MPRLPNLKEMREAQDRIKGLALRTPLIPLNAENTPAEIYLKMENLQPIGSFKIRPAANAILTAPEEALREGVYTASSGNMAQGVAYTARRLSVPATVLLPDTAPEVKINALKRLGSRIEQMSFQEWWRVILEHDHPNTAGHFVHPVADTRVLAGDATIGLEILEDLPDVDTVLAPYGGGGLSTSIAAALRAAGSDARVLAAESAHAAPFMAALEAGQPADIPYPDSFVSGIGNGSVLDEMWPLASELVQGSVVASLDEIADTIRLLYERHRIIAEGAGAAPVASAIAGRAGAGKVVCVISGGNLGVAHLQEILRGKTPAS